MMAAEVGMNLRMVLIQRSWQTASNELTHMNRHSYTADKVNSKVAMVSAGLTSVSPSAMYCSQVDGDTLGWCTNRNSDLDRLSLSRLNAIHSEMKK